MSIVNCQVREARGGGSEVLLTKSSKAPKKFTSVNYTNEPAPVITMNDVPAITNDQTVTVMMTVDPPEDVKKEMAATLRKQDCVIGDSEGCGRVVLWEEDVGKLEEGKSYKLIGLTVRSFRGINYLSAGKDSHIENVTDIGETAQLEDGDLEEKGIVRKVVEGEIDGVLYTDDYEGCISCNAKVKANDDVVAECTKCGMLMK